MTSWKGSLQLENRANQRLYGMLGFAMRAGKLVIGTELICKSLARGTVKHVLVSGAASGATKKKLYVKCEFYNVSISTANIDTEQLGCLLGKSYAPAAVAVTDEGFAREIRKATEE